MLDTLLMEITEFGQNGTSKSKIIFAVAQSPAASPDAKERKSFMDEENGMSNFSQKSVRSGERNTYCYSSLKIKVHNF